MPTCRMRCAGTPAAVSSAAIAADERGRAKVYLQLDSGQSLILRTYATKPQQRGLRPWRYHAARSAGEELEGEWRVDFLSGGEELPNSFATRELASWTELARPTGQSFSGTAHYQLTFDAPSHAGLLKIGQTLLQSSPDAQWQVQMTGHDWLVLAVGFVTAFFVAWGVVAWFMHWVHRHGFIPFAVYRIVLGSAVWIWLV